MTEARLSWDELTEAQKKAVAEQSGYDLESLETEEPYFIADYDFQDYAQELAEDIGAINSDNNWPNYCIDWERAARDLEMDYTTVTLDGTDYLFRSW